MTWTYSSNNDNIMHEKLYSCVSGRCLYFVVAGFLKVINYPEMQMVAFRGWLRFAVPLKLNVLHFGVVAFLGSTIVVNEKLFHYHRVIYYNMR
jgi:uncharacterized integral membrane protein